MCCHSLIWCLSNTNSIAVKTIHENHEPSKRRGGQTTCQTNRALVQQVHGFTTTTCRSKYMTGSSNRSTSRNEHECRIHVQMVRLRPHATSHSTDKSIVAQQSLRDGKSQNTSASKMLMLYSCQIIRKTKRLYENDGIAQTDRKSCKVNKESSTQLDLKTRISSNILQGVDLVMRVQVLLVNWMQEPPCASRRTRSRYVAHDTVELMEMGGTKIPFASTSQK